MIAIEILKLIVLIFIALCLAFIGIGIWLYIDHVGAVDLRTDEEKERDRILNESKKKPRMIIRGFYQGED